MKKPLTDLSQNKNRHLAIFIKKRVIYEKEK